MLNFSVACYDLKRTLGFLNSCALAHALWLHTDLEWKPYRDSTGLNIIYGIMFWKGGPITVDVKQDWEIIERARIEELQRNKRSFFRKVQEGPRAVAGYLQWKQRERDDTLRRVEETFAEARRIQGEMLQEARTAIRRLAVVKAASSISIAVATGGLAVVGSGLAIAAGNVSLAYQVAGHIAKNLESAKEADAIAIDITIGVEKELAEEVIQSKVTAAIAAKAIWTVYNQVGLGMAAKAEIKQLSIELARKVSSAKIAKLTRQIARAQGKLSQSVARSGQALSRASVAARTIPVVFAVKDVIDAVSDYHDDLVGSG